MPKFISKRIDGPSSTHDLDPYGENHLEVRGCWPVARRAIFDRAEKNVIIDPVASRLSGSRLGTTHYSETYDVKDAGEEAKATFTLTVESVMTDTKEVTGTEVRFNPSPRKLDSLDP